jgi:predicted RNase H-like nuclease (RuvC/YqgF family)
MSLREKILVNLLHFFGCGNTPDFNRIVEAFHNQDAVIQRLQTELAERDKTIQELERKLQSTKGILGNRVKALQTLKRKLRLLGLRYADKNPFTTDGNLVTELLDLIG